MHRLKRAWGEGEGDRSTAVSIIQFWALDETSKSCRMSEGESQFRMSLSTPAPDPR